MSHRGLHKSITLNRVIKLVQRRQSSLEDPGICIECGAEASGVEPDARESTCESCGQPAVFGAEELLFFVG